MKKYGITFLCILTLCGWITAQDLIQNTQKGKIPKTTLDNGNTILSELSLHKKVVKTIKPFQFLNKKAQEESLLFLDLNNNVLSDLLKSKSNYLELTIPVDGQHNLELELYKKNILSPNFKVVYSSGKVAVEATHCSSV